MCEQHGEFEHLGNHLFGVRVKPMPPDRGRGRLLRDGRSFGMRSRDASAYAARIVAWLRSKGIIVLDTTR
jgi:hypothetical protein